MALKIKEGVTLHPFGTQCGGFTSESDISESTMEVLFSRFPAENFTEDEETTVKEKSNKKK